MIWLYGECCKEVKGSAIYNAAQSNCRSTLSATTGTLRSQLGWQSLMKRWELHTATWVYQCLRPGLTYPSLSTWLIHKQHQRHIWLSNSSVLIPRAHTNMMSRLFRYTGAVMWNSLPENIKRESTFRAALRCCLASIVLFLWIVEYVLYYNFMFWYVLHV